MRWLSVVLYIKIIEMMITIYLLAF